MLKEETLSDGERRLVLETFRTALLADEMSAQVRRAEQLFDHRAYGSEKVGEGPS